MPAARRPPKITATVCTKTATEPSKQHPHNAPTARAIGLLSTTFSLFRCTTCEKKFRSVKNNQKNYKKIKRIAPCHVTRHNMGGCSATVINAHVLSKHGRQMLMGLNVWPSPAPYLGFFQKYCLWVFLQLLKCDDEPLRSSTRRTRSLSSSFSGM